jgi:hypothetical protein
MRKTIKTQMTHKQRSEYTLTHGHYLSLIILANLQVKHNKWSPAI